MTKEIVPCDLPPDENVLNIFRYNINGHNSFQIVPLEIIVV
jgi:hypothetical protein